MYGTRTTSATIGLNAQLLALDAGYRSAGITAYIYQLLRHLPQVSDYRFVAWMGERAGDLAGVERRVTVLPTERPAVRILWEQALQPWALRCEQPSLLHGMAFALPLWPLTMPAVVTIYDLTFIHRPHAFHPLKRLYLHRMAERSARRADHVCTISQHGRADVAAQFGIPPEKISVVYPGLDPRFDQPPTKAEVAAFRANKGLPARFVLYLGTLEPRKNLPMLVRAFARLRRTLPDVTLVLAGGKGWGYEEIFAEVARLGLSDVVLFPGFVPNEEQALWYAAATLFAYPSEYEGFGLPPLEAMACGTPVITSDAASLPEVVGDAGLTLPCHDEAAWADVMATLLNDHSQRDERGARGVAQAAKFRWQASARAQTAVYDRLLAEG
ncbi:MAG: glycosyltransferase family 4 protein [Anaerolineales bacterium]|nr:glycosyltransferase family 4 protein [Anaerolineales bacterium]MCB9127349.1 glycosyltransferase family 4 protein [Ardenticatenales bacterium]